jgi:two-component system chemotaxis response regulator CheB
MDKAGELMLGSREIEAVVIGASAGGVEAITRLVKALPASFVVPIAVVLHLPEGGRSLLPELLRDIALIKVKEAEDKDQLEPGCIYLAPADYHLLIEKEKTISLSTEDPVNFSRPSIDVLFESAAVAFGEKLLGILLTGANSDGALGLRKIKEKGGVIMVQDPGTAVASAMPESGIECASPDYVLQLDEIARFMATLKAGGKNGAVSHREEERG